MMGENGPPERLPPLVRVGYDPRRHRNQRQDLTYQRGRLGTPRVLTRSSQSRGERR
eukprot:COSAG01_NODE_62851_length_282_cov_1.442623_1_plen_55_part_01